MKLSILAPLVAAASLSACATHLPAGMKANEFVAFSCEGGKRFSARAAEGGESVRVRYEGGWELARKADGLYEGDGWSLATGPAAELSHGGKVVAKGCKPG